MFKSQQPTTMVLEGEIGKEELPQIADMLFRLAHRGITWHPVVVSDHTTRHDVLEELRDLVKAGVLSTPVAETLPAHQAALAHQKLEAGGLRGRLVLTW